MSSASPRQVQDTEQIVLRQQGQITQLIQYMRVSPAPVIKLDDLLIGVSVSHWSLPIQWLTRWTTLG